MNTLQRCGQSTNTTATAKKVPQKRLYYIDCSANVTLRCSPLSCAAAQQFFELPHELTKVSGDLDLSYTGITQLPQGLTVGGNLDLSGTGITQLPKDLKVTGQIF